MMITEDQDKKIVDIVRVWADEFPPERFAVCGGDPVLTVTPEDAHEFGRRIVEEVINHG